MEDIARAAAAACRVAFRLNQSEKAATFLRKFGEVLTPMRAAQRTEVLTKWFARLATPEMRPHWPRACRTLLENQPPEVTEALRAFAGVADVLESRDGTVLDALPPEQRDFALKILERFEPPRPGDVP